MQISNSEISLRNSIAQLEMEQSAQIKQLKEQFHMTFESIRPINLIKNTFEEVTESPNLKNNIINTSVGLGAGYLSKLLFVSISNNPLKKLLGTVLLFGITNLVAKHPETVKSLGNGALKIIKNIAGNRVFHKKLDQ